MSAPAAPRWRFPVLLLVALLVGSAVAGVLWWVLWTPPTGQAYQGRFLYDDSEQLGDVFGGTGLFVLVAAGLGVLVGATAGSLVRRDELAVVATVLVGAALGTVVMVAVGHLLGPPDPDVLARTAPDRTPLQGDLWPQGWSPWLAMPTGALTGLVVTLLALARHDRGETAEAPGSPSLSLDGRSEPAPRP